MKIYEIFQRNPAYIGCKLGVEVEVEGKHLPDFLADYWNITKDPSLRGESFEYIMKKPMTLLNTKKSLKYLVESMVDNRTELDFSCRTSVHVHLNVSDLDVKELLNIMYLYYLFEDLFLQYCGEERYENRFCLSIRNADFILSDILNYFPKNHLEMFEDQRHKYASLNLAAIPAKGSIEFRGMRGTLNLDVLNPWLETISSLYTLGCSFKSLKEINAFINEKGILELANKLFKKNFQLFFKDGSENQIYYNMSLCAELPELNLDIVQEPVKVQAKYARLDLGGEAIRGFIPPMNRVVFDDLNPFNPNFDLDVEQNEEERDGG